MHQETIQSDPYPAVSNHPRETKETVVDVSHLRHVYPPTRSRTEPRVALSDLTFSIQQGEIFSVLGPNGSGKSTLFKILSTLIPPRSGRVTIAGYDLAEQSDEIRWMLGVVFQNPSVDKKLTVRENLMHQGHLYGIRGKALDDRIEATLTTIALRDRRNERVEHLSGGMQRRVELAKSLLHQPNLLILDEPSTGLDPGARRDFTETLRTLRDEEGVTILLTTHLLDEAEHSDRIAILDNGTLMALDTPLELKNAIGGDIITITSPAAQTIYSRLLAEFGEQAQLVDGTIRIEIADGHEFIPTLIQRFPGVIDSVTLAKPTLEDVFIRKTGHQFWSNENSGRKDTDNGR